jgi:hypothetical protein
MIAVVLCAAAVVMGSPASAAQLLFYFQEDDGGSLLFTLNSKPVVADFAVTFRIANETEIWFDITPEEYFDGEFVSSDYFTIWFESSDLDGGLAITGHGDYLALAKGPQLYTGTSANQELLTGSFRLEGVDPDGDDGQFYLQPSGTLTVSQIGAIPEPASWAMMLLGFVAIGTTMRRRKASRGMRVKCTTARSILKAAHDQGDEVSRAVSYPLCIR